MELVCYHPTFKNHITNYRLDDSTYTGVPKEVIDQEIETFSPILGFDKNKLVTFFVLDEGEDKFNYTSDSASLLLRAFSTDSNELRKGYGLKSLLLLQEFTNEHFPSINKIVLAVNEKNDAANSLYLKAGFKDTTRRFLGPKGPQKILELLI